MNGIFLNSIQFALKVLTWQKKIGQKDFILLFELESILPKIENIGEYFWAIVPRFSEELSPETEMFLFKATKPTADRYLAARLELDMALISICQGKLEEAISHYQHLLDRSLNNDYTDSFLRLILLAKLGIGAYSYYLGKPNAKENLISGLQLAKEKDLNYFLPAFLCEYGKIMIDKGEYDKAQVLFNEGLHQARICDMPYLFARIKAEVGNLNIKCNNTKSALKEWEEALEIVIKMKAFQLQTQLMLNLRPFSSLIKKKKYEERIIQMTKTKDISF